MDVFAVGDDAGGVGEARVVVDDEDAVFGLHNLELVHLGFVGNVPLEVLELSVTVVAGSVGASFVSVGFVDDITLKQRRIVMVKDGCELTHDSGVLQIGQK